ncbi:MAG: serine/threonine protein kinase [Myxococcales bacterium]|nr:serine/threonine protein kinase [Myxococcales bacterium]
MDLTGHNLLGKYEVEALLGQGGMAAVWRASHVLTGRKVAIKVLDESYIANKHVTRRFLREARAASAVAHPGVVEVLDIDQMESGLPFIVMEFLEGETLARRIERRGRLDQDEMVRLGTMLLEALEAAHAQGVVHRDLKPENIYVVPAGRRGEAVKILDFGISHMVEEDQQKLTMTGSVLGTPHYMSPEQAMGETEVDHRADLYAAGVVLYECVVGDVPFDAPNYNKLLRRILDEEAQTPRERGATINESVERVILWAMEKDRERRIGSAREMLDWLLRADSGEAVPYERPSRPASGSRELPSLEIALEETPPEHPEEAPSWEISEELIQGVSPPIRSAEIEIPPAALATEELEIDEEALRSSPGTLTRPRTVSSEALPKIGVGSTSSVGQHVAISDPPPPLHSDPPPPASGLHSVPPRLGSVTGGYERVRAPEPPPERPAWQRWAVIGVVGIGVFVGLVYAVRWVVDPGGDPVPPPVAGPEPEPEAPAPEQSHWVSIRVVGLPPQARMQLDGLPASSPIRLRRGSHHVVEIEAEGYDLSLSHYREDVFEEVQYDRPGVILDRLIQAEVGDVTEADLAMVQSGIVRELLVLKGMVG